MVVVPGTATLCVRTSAVREFSLLLGQKLLGRLEKCGLDVRCRFIFTRMLRTQVYEP